MGSFSGEGAHFLERERSAIATGQFPALCIALGTDVPPFASTVFDFLRKWVVEGGGG